MINLNRIKQIVVPFCIFLIVLCMVYLFPNISLLKDYTSINITALNDKNEQSLGSEIWISKVYSENKVYNLEDIDYDNNWTIKDNNLVYIGSDKSSINLSISNCNNIFINFLKHPYSGKMTIEVDDAVETLDLYSAEGTSFTIERAIQNSLNWKSLIISSVVYYVVLIVVIYFMKKYPLLQNLIPLALYIFLNLIFENNNVKYGILFSFMFFSYFVICKKYKQNMYLLIIPFLIYLFLYKFIMPINFHITSTSSHILFVFTNISFITVLLYLFYFGANFLSKLKEKNSFYLCWLKLFLIIFVITFVILILIWPGNWIWDEKSILLCAQTFTYSNWQSYLMVLFYSWALMIFPFTISIVLFQMLLIDFIFGYVLSKIYEMHKNKKEIVFLIILLSLPPVILNILYPLRSAIYSSLELLFLFQLYYLKKNSVEIKKEHLIFFSFCIVILSFWRSEGIYYLVLGPIVIYILFKRYLMTMKKFLLFIICLGGFFLIYSPFKVLERNNPSNYNLTIFPNALSMMLQEDIKITDSEYQNLNNVLDLEIIKQYPAYHETPSFFAQNIVRDDYKNHMKEFLISYVKVIIKNLYSYINARTKTFLATTGMDRKHINNSPWDFYNTEYTGSDYEILNMINNDALSKPWNYELRSKILHFMKGATTNNDFSFYGQVIWNFIPMLISLIIIVIYKICKKEYAVSLLTCLCLVKVPIVYLTAPANYFFYYLSIYIIGIFPIAYWLSNIKLGGKNARKKINFEAGN